MFNTLNVKFVEEFDNSSQEVIIAMPSAPGERVRAIVEYLGRHEILAELFPP